MQDGKKTPKGDGLDIKQKAEKSSSSSSSSTSSSSSDSEAGLKKKKKDTEKPKKTIRRAPRKNKEASESSDDNKSSSSNISSSDSGSEDGEKKGNRVKHKEDFSDIEDPDFVPGSRHDVSRYYKLKDKLREKVRKEDLKKPLNPDEEADQVWTAYFEPQYEGDRDEMGDISFKHMIAAQRRALAMYERRKNRKPRKPVRKPDIPAVTSSIQILTKKVKESKTGKPPKRKTYYESDTSDDEMFKDDEEYQKIKSSKEMYKNLISQAKLIVYNQNVTRVKPTVLEINKVLNIKYNKPQNVKMREKINF